MSDLVLGLGAIALYGIWLVVFVLVLTGSAKTETVRAFPDTEWGREAREIIEAENE